MQMRSDGPYGESQAFCNLLVTSLFLMVEDQNTSFDAAELQQGFFDEQLQFACLQVLLRAGRRMMQPRLPR